MFGDTDHQNGGAAHGWAAEAGDIAAGVEQRLGLGGHGDQAPHEQLDLSEKDGLPWLESGHEEDEEDYVGIDSKRVMVAVIAMVALLGAVVSGIYWFTHRGANAAQIADGSTIAAPPGPYKEAPKDPGGKTYEGTGDSSFAASQGENRTAQLADNGAMGSASNAAAAAASAAAISASAASASATPGSAGVAPPPVAASPVTAPVAAAATDYSGGVVQVGAYTSQVTAEAGWNRLVKQSSVLSGVQHRIVEGKADIGTVYRLQALTGAGGGTALCGKLHAEGLACQVKH